MDPKKPMKISFVGDSGVGKTSIINRKVKGTFIQNLASTIGSSHQVAHEDLDGTDVELRLWDTAGQEKYQSLVPLYVRDSLVICVVASYDDRTSIQNVQKWIETSQEQCTTAHIVVIINKIDKAKDMVTAMQEVQEVPGFDYPNTFYVSAMDGTNIDSMFYTIAQLGLTTREVSTATNTVQPIEPKEETQPNKGCC